MTPSVPIASIASAIREPIVRSLLADMEATCVIWSLVVMATALSLSLATTSSTAFSIPDLIPIGFTPTEEDFNPSSIKAKAIKLEVVVPSPEL